MWLGDFGSSPRMIEFRNGVAGLEGTIISNTGDYGHFAGRMQGDSFALTHEFLAIMLGVRRAGVSEAAAELFHGPTLAFKDLAMQLLARIMTELGVDMDAYVRDRQRAGARFTGDEADMQIQDWIDATLFNFMIDREVREEA